MDRRRRSRLAALLLAPWTAWALVRTFGFDRVHPVVAAVSFTPYAAASAPLPLAAALALRCGPVAAGAAATCGLLARAVAPRSRPTTQPQAAGPRVVVATANLYFGAVDPQAVVDVVCAERVDVLAVQEVPANAIAALRAAGLERELPHLLDDSAPGALGTAIWCRRPIRRTGHQTLPGRAAAPEGLVDGLQVRAVHPWPPVNPRWTRWWRDELAGYPAAGGAGPLRVIAGDLNATLDHRELRRLLDRGYADAADRTGDGLAAWTWPQDRHVPPITIDHVLVDRRIRVERAATHALPGGDHRMLVAHLRLP